MKRPQPKVNYRFRIENDALVLGLPPAEAEQLSQTATRHLKTWQAAHQAATAADIDEYLYRELQKLQPKLADFYRNRDKLI